MTTAAELAHCTGDPGCPVRFRYGPPRLCPDHGGDSDGDGERAARYGVAMSAPGGREPVTPAKRK